MMLQFFLLMFLVMIPQVQPNPGLKLEELHIPEELLMFRTPEFVSYPSHFRADISFMIVDLKYRLGHLKILEFGEGHRSGFRGHNNLYETGAIMNRFWQYLLQFKKPTWFLTTDPIGRMNKRGKAFFPRTFGYKSFIRLGGRVVKDFDALEKDQRFIGASQGHYRSPCIGDFKGIVISKTYKTAHITKKYENHNYGACKLCREVRAFRLHHPDFILLDDASCLYAANKKFADKLFQQKALSRYRPNSGVYEKEYTPDLAAKIISDIRSEILVIKPLTSSHGNGIIFVKEEELDSVLCRILRDKDKIDSTATANYRHWITDRSDTFLVESYEPSKLISLRGKRYDATMRVAFALHHNKSKLYVTFFGAYWKLPRLSVDSPGELEAKIKSFVSRSRANCSAKVSSKDMLGVKIILKKILPKLYLKMLEIKRDYYHF